MADNSLLEKVDFLLKKSLSGKCNEQELDTIISYLELHSNNPIVGKVFGYSVSDYAYAALWWIGSAKSKMIFKEYFDKLSPKRQNEINELIKRELYKEY